MHRGCRTAVLRFAFALRFVLRTAFMPHYAFILPFTGCHGRFTVFVLFGSRTPLPCGFAVLRLPRSTVRLYAVTRVPVYVRRTFGHGCAAAAVRRCVARAATFGLRARIRFCLVATTLFTYWVRRFTTPFTFTLVCAHTTRVLTLRFPCLPAGLLRLPVLTLLPTHMQFTYRAVRLHAGL